MSFLNHKSIVNVSSVTVVSIFFLFGCTDFGNNVEADIDVPDQTLVLVENGESRAPIVIAEDATPPTRHAGEELADYMEKIGGVRPEVLNGRPDPTPENAIWVGYHPHLDDLFPETDFDFENPEEILIASTENHLVIAGRDRWDGEDPATQNEFGTVNAVYTFLQDYLDVRWLWPGETGTDIIEKEKIAFEPFEYRYHPQIRSRRGVLRLSATKAAYAQSPEFTRKQRLQLDSLTSGGGHAFTDWWERFHEDRPEFFALQPDGTRSGYPSPRTVKICQSNPDVWEQWMRDVEDQLRSNPQQIVFNASPNDGWSSGHCICEDCREWDHPDAELRRFGWEGVSQDYYALSDRHVTFANTLARKLEQKYPDEDYYVLMMAYGHSRPVPIEAVPDDNVIISSVANFIFRPDNTDRGSPNDTPHRVQFAGWGDVADNLFWRPNTGNPHGWRGGEPAVFLEQTIKDFRFIGENNCVGIFIDTVWEHYATQAPLYYVMAQMTWDPFIDGHEVLQDFYHRGFGKAAGEIEDYWNYLEDNMGDYNDEEYYNQAYGYLDEAQSAVENEPEIYTERIDFLRMGLDYVRYLSEARAHMNRFRESDEQDTEAADAARELWLEKIKPLAQDEEHPYAINWGPIRPGHGRVGGTYPEDLRRKW